MPRLTPLLALITLGLSSYGWADEMPKPLAIPTANSEVLALCNTITDALANNAKELEQKLGKVEKEEKVNLPNRHHPDTKDVRHMLRYSDGLVSIYTVPSLKLSYLEAAILTKHFWPKPIPMLLGLNSEELKQRFGKPDEEDKERIVYICSYETGDSINFLLANDRAYRLVLRNAIE